MSALTSAATIKGVDVERFLEGDSNCAMLVLHHMLYLLSNGTTIYRGLAKTNSLETNLMISNKCSCLSFDLSIS